MLWTAFYVVVGLLAMSGSLSPIYRQVIALHGVRGLTWLAGCTLLVWSVSTYVWVKHLNKDRTGKKLSLTLTTVGLLVGTACLSPPLLSQDLYLYAAYGRQIAIHYSNPYRVPLTALMQDPIIASGDPFWYGQTSFLGGLALAFFALGAFIVPSSSLGTLGRIIKFFWVIPYALLGRALWLRWRGHSNRVIFLAAILGNPAILFLALLEAHLEIWVMALLVFTGLALSQRKAAESALFLALATGFKMTTFILVPICACWLWARVRQSAAVFCVVYGVLYGGFLLLLGGAEWPGVLNFAKTTPGMDFGAFIPQLLFFLGFRQMEAIVTISDGIFYISIAGVCLAVLAGRWEKRPYLPMALALAALYFTRVYVQPWYMLWFWPLMWLSMDGTRAILRSIAVWTVCAIVANLYIWALTPWSTAALFAFDLWWNYRSEVSEAGQPVGQSQ